MDKPTHASETQRSEKPGSIIPGPMTKNGGKNFNEEDSECQNKWLKSNLPCGF